MKEQHPKPEIIERQTRAVSSPERGREIEEELKREREKVLTDVRWVLGDPRGRRFIQLLLDETGAYKSAWTGNSETFYLVGKQDVGHFLMGLICESDIMALVQLTRERVNEQKAREAKMKRKRGE